MSTQFAGVTHIKAGASRIADIEAIAAVLLQLGGGVVRRHPDIEQIVVHRVPAVVQGQGFSLGLQGVQRIEATWNPLRTLAAFALIGSPLIRHSQRLFIGQLTDHLGEPQLLPSTCTEDAPAIAILVVVLVLVRHHGHG